MKTQRTIGILSILLLFLLFIPSFGCAESDPVDLSSMTLDALIALKDKLNLAIWNSSEWKEVTVPQGIWEIGVDIPAGHWTIKPTSGNMASLHWGRSLSEYKTDIKDTIAYEVITDVDFILYESNSSKTLISFELKEGTYIKIDGSSVVFCPYEGKLSFLFD